MGWSFRKSFRLLPGIRVNLSKSGPRLSVGFPGARASIDMNGKARVYGSAGPIRFQKQMQIGTETTSRALASRSLLETLKKWLGA
jgi:hypothetical protein